MGTDSRLRTASRDSHRWRYAAAIIGAFAVAGLLYLGNLLRAKEPNYYRPARTALVEVRHRLAESFSHEAAMIEQLRLARAELNAALAHLDKASRLDPEDRRLIETLHVRLKTLEDPSRVSQMSREQLHQSYQALMAQLDGLIEKFEEPLE